MKPSCFPGTTWEINNHKSFKKKQKTNSWLSAVFTWQPFSNHTQGGKLKCYIPRDDLFRESDKLLSFCCFLIDQKPNTKSLNVCLATCETVVWHMIFQPGVWRKRKMSCECDQSAKLLFLTLVITLNSTFGASLLSRLKCAWLLRPSEAWRHSSWRTSQWGNIMLQCIECIVNEKGEYCWTVTFEHVTFYALRQFCVYYKLVATRRSDKRVSCVSRCVVSH